MINFRRSAVISALLLAALGSTAIAQSGQNAAGTGGTSIQGSDSRMQAPIGHRQPRPSDFTNEQRANSIDQISPEDAALNRKLRSICRGC
jgi:hypothetical protein